MCRNIRPLFNFEPPASDDEIRAAALQFVRKISGFSKPSQANAAAFDRAVDDVSKVGPPAPRLDGHRRRSPRPRHRGCPRPRTLPPPLRGPLSPRRQLRYVSRCNIPKLRVTRRPSERARPPKRLDTSNNPHETALVC